MKPEIDQEALEKAGVSIDELFELTGVKDDNVMDVDESDEKKKTMEDLIKENDELINQLFGFQNERFTVDPTDINLGRIKSFVENVGDEEKACGIIFGF